MRRARIFVAWLSEPCRPTAGSESHATLLAASGRVRAEKNAQSLPTDQRLRILTEKPVRPAIFSLRATLS